MMKLVWIGAFGLAGVFARWGMLELTHRLSFPFPMGTLLVNLLGSLLAGIAYVWAIERGAVSPELAAGILLGLLGGFTTFSSFSVETLRLLEAGAYLQAGAYFFLSPVLGLLAAYGGVALTRGWMG